MKNCFSCGADCQPDAKFCHQCGRDFTKGARAARPEPPRSEPPRSTYPHAESLAQLEALKARKMRKAWILAGVGIALMTAGLVGPRWEGSVLLLVPFFAMAIFALRIKKWDYYAIAHSRVDGEHRCIFCGNRGIWRKGVYKSNEVIHNCSQCKKELYRD